MEGGQNKNGSQSCDPRRHEGPGVFASGGHSSPALLGQGGWPWQASPAGRWATRALAW